MREPDSLAIRNERLKAAGNLFAALGVLIWTAVVFRPMFDGNTTALTPGDAVAWFMIGLASILTQHFLLGLIEKEK